jgi:hypothetical protein
MIKGGKMLFNKFSNRRKPIIGLLIMLGISYLFLNPDVSVSQDDPKLNITNTEDITVKSPNRGEVIKLKTESSHFQRKGDVNFDGIINEIDIDLIVDIILERYTPTPEEFWAADCNDDGVINVLDVQLATNWFLEEAQIIVIYPNGGEAWIVNETQTIIWDPSIVSSNVKIEISIDSGDTWSPINDNTDNDSEEDWTPSSNFISNSCLIKICSVRSENEIYDQSDGLFSITEPQLPAWISVVSPNGGEIWYVGSTEDIEWYSENTSGNVKIEYSTNGGSSWTTVVSNTSDDGSCSWAIPNTPSTNCYVQITDVDGTPSDLSDRQFTIASGTEWKVPITISGGGKTYIRTFGGDASATDGFDLGLDVDTAPPGMIYYAYFEIDQFPNYLDTDIRRWVSPYDTDINWTLKIIHTNGATSILSWNSADLPSGSGIGFFFLTGLGLNVDMRSQGSAQVSGDANLTIKYETTPPMVTYNFPQQGWYLISLPIFPDNNNLNVLFPSALSAFAYNSTTMSYYSVASLEPKKGYWLSIPGPTTSTIIGVPLNSYKEHYNTGWHLIGTVMGATNFTDPNDNPNGAVISTYGWNPGASTYYRVYPPGTAVLNEQEGYWLAVAKSCDLTIGGSALSKDAVASEVDTEPFFQRFGAQPPAPPFAADRCLAQSLPTENVSSRVYPNPFNLETKIEYWLPQAAFTNVYIYNSMGQRIRTLVETQQMQGIHHVVWDCRNDNGEIVTNGIYFYRIIAPELVEVQKIILLK